VHHDGKIREIILVSDDPLDVTRLTGQVAHLIENDVLRHPLMRSKTIWQIAGRPAREGVFAQLLASGAAIEAGDGQVTVGDPVLSLMDHFDEVLTTKVIELFDAREYRYPTLIPTHVLEKCGYFTSFPQYLMFVTRLHSDADVYRSFLADYDRTGHLDPSVLHHCDNVDYCLPPTMCFHTFNQYRHRAVDGANGQVVTARGKSFRYESRYAVSLERLWDFTIREVVFFGSRDFVLAARQRLMTAVFDYLAELDLTGHCEVANDPFFGGADTTHRILSQRMLELKYELRLMVDTERSVAVFFSRNFEITHNGRPVQTGCAGFGLERLAYAFLCQYGVDPTVWPPQVRQAMGRRTLGALAGGQRTEA